MPPEVFGGNSILISGAYKITGLIVSINGLETGPRQTAGAGTIEARNGHPGGTSATNHARFLGKKMAAGSNRVACESGYIVVYDLLTTISSVPQSSGVYMSQQGHAGAGDGFRVGHGY
jgi:hypothetical protein